MSNSVKEYRVPLMIGAGALVVALIIWAVLVSPQNSKLASLQTQETQLQNQATGLQIKLASLKTEQQKLSGSCADLQKIATQIPSVQTPTDIDAEESSFEGQFNALTASSGVQLTQFSGFAPATSTSAAPASTGTSSTTPSDVTAVPTTLAVTGTFGQMSAFINGLDSFPRLFVIQSFVLSYGTNAATSSSGSSSSSSSSSSSGSSGSASGPPLWTGGVATASGAAPYSLSITGSIYYTSTPSALDACTKATAATTAAK